MGSESLPCVENSPAYPVGPKSISLEQNTRAAYFVHPKEAEQITMSIAQMHKSAVLASALTLAVTMSAPGHAADGWDGLGAQIHRYCR